MSEEDSGSLSHRVTVSGDFFSLIARFLWIGGEMYFRFGSALLLVLAISLGGIAFEKRNLELRRRLTRQHYQTAVLLEKHAKLRLKTQRLGSPNRVLKAVRPGQLESQGAANHLPSVSSRVVPLLRWQRQLPESVSGQP